MRRPAMIFLIGFALTGCIGAPAPESPFAGETVPTAPPVVTTARERSPTLAPVAVRAVRRGTYYRNLHYDLWIPSVVEATTLPIVVVVPGDSPNGNEGLTALAQSLAEHGSAVMMIELATPIVGARHPEPLVALSCALTTISRDAPAYGADSDNLTLLGYDFGAPTAMIVGQAPSLFLSDCPAAGQVESGSDPETETTPVPGGRVDPPAVRPAKLVGIAGAYDLSLLDSNDSPNDSLRAYFGGTKEDQAGMWNSGDPLAYLGQNPDIPVLLLGGGLDTIVPWSVQMFWANALTAAGNPVELVKLPDSGHTSIVSPDGELDRVVEEVMRFVRAPIVQRPSE